MPAPHLLDSPSRPRAQINKHRNRFLVCYRNWPRQGDETPPHALDCSIRSPRPLPAPPTSPEDWCECGPGPRSTRSSCHPFSGGSLRRLSGPLPAHSEDGHYLRPSPDSARLPWDPFTTTRTSFFSLRPSQKIALEPCGLPSPTSDQGPPPVAGQFYHAHGTALMLTNSAVPATAP